MYEFIQRVAIVRDSVYAIMRMKRISLIVIVCFFTLSCMPFIPPGATTPARQEDFQGFKRVFEVNQTKDQIFSSAKSWVARSYRSAQKVIDLEDRENGQIICKGTIAYMPGYGSYLYYTMVIDIKDYKYRVSFENMTGRGSTGFTWGTDQMSKAHADLFRQEFESACSGLYAYVTKAQKRDDF
jgi:hypothetical protein